MLHVIPRIESDVRDDLKAVSHTKKKKKNLDGTITLRGFIMLYGIDEAHTVCTVCRVWYQWYGMYCPALCYGTTQYRVGYVSMSVVWIQTQFVCCDETVKGDR